MSKNNTSELLKCIDVVGLVFKPNTKELKDIYMKIKKDFEDANISVIIEEKSAKMIGYEDGVCFDDMCKKSDFIASIGGDGTLISVVRKSLKYNKSILGINLGTLGFLTDIKPDELPKFLVDFKKDNYCIDERIMMQSSIGQNKYIAFNDIVITREKISHMLNIDAYIDDELFNSYYGDGLIVSTPMGSTAYNLSCNGPIVHPLSEAYIITPISPHSLTQRPIVLPKNFNTSFRTRDKIGALAIIDGQDIYTLSQDEYVKIEVLEQKSKLIRRVNRKYFDVLSQKLNWGKQ